MEEKRKEVHIIRFQLLLIKGLQFFLKTQKMMTSENVSHDTDLLFQQLNLATNAVNEVLVNIVMCTKNKLDV